MIKKLTTFLLIAFVISGSVSAFFCPCCFDMKAKTDKKPMSKSENAPTSSSCCQHKQQKRPVEKERQKGQQSRQCNCNHFFTDKIHRENAIINNIHLQNINFSNYEIVENIQLDSYKNIIDCFSNSPPLIQNLTISTTILLI